MLTKGEFLGRPTEVGGYAPNARGLRDRRGKALGLEGRLRRVVGLEPGLRGGSWDSLAKTAGPAATAFGSP